MEAKALVKMFFLVNKLLHVQFFPQRHNIVITVTFLLHSLSSGDLSVILSLVIKNATEKDKRAVVIVKSFSFKALVCLIV